MRGAGGSGEQVEAVERALGRVRFSEGDAAQSVHQPVQIRLGHRERPILLGGRQQHVRLVPTLGPAESFGQFGETGVHNGDQQVVLVREVLVDHRSGVADPARDRPHRDGVIAALFGCQRPGGVQQAAPEALACLCALVAGPLDSSIRPWH
ncbi:hypothetical protein LUW76_25400 [Actinomadura madurae]|nr:hypothetical protein [Actinomadura madurae]URM97421.1 hypothetical protein LUW76_25400 [Actinomadura madurae]